MPEESLVFEKFGDRSIAGVNEADYVANMIYNSTGVFDSNNIRIAGRGGIVYLDDYQKYKDTSKAA